MNLYQAFLVLTLFEQFPQPAIPAGISLEKCFEFEIEESVMSKAKLQTRREVCFTSAELPWTGLGIRGRTNLEEGFDASVAAAEFDFAGKKVQGKKLTWKRNLKHPANVSAAAIYCWVLPEVQSPSFKVRLGRRLEFQLPAGCVKMEVVPHEKNAEGIPPFELESSMAATGEYNKTTTYKLGEKDLEAHEMVFMLGAGKGTITFTVSKDLPGNICAMSIDGEVSGTLRVKTMTPAPLPSSLDYFPNEGFAFAAPAGFAKTAKLKEGEVARYVKGDDFIAVSLLELGKGGLIELQHEIQQADNKYDLRFVGYSRYRHLAGHNSFDATHTKTKVSVIVTQHGGRAYLLSASVLNRLTVSETREFLKGWRWLVGVGRK